MPNRVMNLNYWEFLRCAPPFYTAPLSPNQIYGLGFSTHPLPNTHTLSKHITLSGSLSQTHPFPSLSKTRKTLWNVKSDLLKVKGIIILNTIQRDSAFLKQHACQSVALHNQNDVPIFSKNGAEMNVTDLMTPTRTQQTSRLETRDNRVPLFETFSLFSCV